MSHLQDYLVALSQQTQNVESVTRNPQGDPPWSMLFDPDHAPTEVLGWLAQWSGVTLENKSTAEDDAVYWGRQRFRIKSAQGQKRGTKDAMIASLQPYLIGNKTVLFRERDPDAYHLTVVTRTEETLDAVAAETALRHQKPAGIILDYHTLTGNDWGEVFAADPTWADALTHWGTWQGMLEGTPMTPPGSSGTLPGSTRLPGSTTLPGD